MCWHHQWLSFSGDNGIGAPRGRVLHARFPCLIRSCGWHQVSKGKEPNYPAALAGCATVSRPEVNSLVFPRATNSGGRSGEPGFLCASVRWREGERTGEQRVVQSPAQLQRQTDRQMSCSSPAPSLSPRLCLRHAGEEDDDTPAHAVYNPHVTMRRIFNCTGARAQGPLIEPSAWHQEIPQWGWWYPTSPAPDQICHETPLLPCCS